LQEEGNEGERKGYLFQSRNLKKRGDVRAERRGKGGKKTATARQKEISRRKGLLFGGEGKGGGFHFPFR